MKKIITGIFLLFTVVSFAQIHEVGVNLNAGRILGDQFQFSKSFPDFGGIGFTYKRNKNPRITYRAALNYLKLDQNDIFEASAGIDFNFIKYNHTRVNNKKSTPYIIFELAMFSSKNQNNSSELNIALPLGLGYKHAITRKLILALEAKARVAFVDSLDQITTNPSTNDMYYYTGLSLFYTFGRPDLDERPVF